MPENVSALEIVVRCVVVYVFIFICLRFLGKKEIGELRPFDLVLLLIISEATQNAMTAADPSLMTGLIAVATLVVFDRAVSQILCRIPPLQKALEGSPTVLVSQGRILWPNMNKEKITEEDLLQSCREGGVADVQDVRLAVLEVDGNISVIPKEKS